jgi:hypothetical protein
MTPINLDKLLQLAPAGGTDTSALKLMVAQLYNGQVQQLTGGQFRLQLPTAQGPLLVNLPQTASPMLQQLLQPAMMRAEAATVQRTLSPASAALSQKIPLQVQFQPQADGRIGLLLQASAASQAIALAPAQLRQLLLAMYSSQVAATPSSATSNGSSTALVTAHLTNPTVPHNIQLPRIAPLPITAQVQDNLSRLLSGSQTNQLTVLLELSNTDTVVSANLLLPRTTEQQGGAGLLNRSQQIVLLQQLVKSFNQQHLSTKDSRHPVLALLKPVLNALPPSAAPFMLQLQPRDGLFQLQLIPQRNQLQLAVSSEDFNRPVQFSAQTSGAHVSPSAAVHRSDTPQQAIQQAWRHLLPLLPQRADPLISLPELPEPVQQILQLLRQSQPDSNKVLPASQLLPQLNSMLQFQPLQTNVNLQTSGGTLAVAIQLLLGHLLQKPPPAASQPANQKLAQLVNGLEPAQASSLLRQLASHSSTLQQSQLATLDSNTTTQQQLLLQLPLQQGEHSVFSQIQLEQREADGKQPGEKQTQWQLTMKFDLDQLGPLLVIAKLQQQQLQLQLFTEQALAKRLADKFLPILKDRCTVQGLHISQADCVLGKIPDSLLPRANSLLAIKV